MPQLVLLPRARSADIPYSTDFVVEIRRP
jgi:hypothetical protein